MIQSDVCKINEAFKNSNIEFIAYLNSSSNVLIMLSSYKATIKMSEYKLRSKTLIYSQIIDSDILGGEKILTKEQFDNLKKTLESYSNAMQNGGTGSIVAHEQGWQGSTYDTSKPYPAGQTNVPMANYWRGENLEALTNAERIVIVACGTSWHAGLVAEYIFEDLCRIPVEVEYASEFRYRNPVINKGDIIIAISQSGETADTLVA